MNKRFTTPIGDGFFTDIIEPYPDKSYMNLGTAYTLDPKKIGLTGVEYVALALKHYITEDYFIYFKKKGK